MPGKNKAFRKKSTSKKEPVDLRATRFTATPQTCNPIKFSAVKSRIDSVRVLKNEMSIFVYNNLPSLQKDNKSFLKTYKQFSNLGWLNAWETQTVYQGICGDYTRRIASILDVYAFKRITGFTCSTYTNTVYQKNKIPAGLKLAMYRPDSPKPHSYSVKAESSRLTRVCNYLWRIGDTATFAVAKVKNSELAEDIKLFQQNPLFWQRILVLIASRNVRLIKKVTLFHYKTGTHALHPKQSNAQIVLDKTNKIYQLFFKVRKTDVSKDDFYHLPLIYDKRYKKPEDIRPDAQFLLKSNGKKISIIVSYEAAEPVFSEKTIEKNDAIVLGVDANSKSNLLSDSEGKFYDIDRLRLNCLIAQLEKLLPKKDSVLNFHQKKRLKKLMVQNQESIKARLAGWVKEWASAGITDVVLEDLTLCKDATLITHPLHKVKYSKLVRLLRLSNLKVWLASMLEKRGIRLHMTHAAYTSQQCGSCNHIDRDNRRTQEEFVCVKCQHNEHADTNAPKVIASRATTDVLRSALHVFDKHGRASPKQLSYRAVRSVLTQHYMTPGGFIETLTPG